MRYTIFFLLWLFPAAAFCQFRFSVVVVNGQRQAVVGATVKLIRNGKAGVSLAADSGGVALFTFAGRGAYRFLISSAGYQSKVTDEYHLPGVAGDTVRLLSANTALQEVTVTGYVPLVERKRDRTIVNVEASPANAGSTVLEVLERSPGVTVDRNGGIALNGKPGVLVMIDDKPTYLSGDDLNTLLSSMNSSQVSKIELMANPSARYDAAGNAGIINIKTKKNSNDGFNGTLTTSVGQGIYPKTNNSVVLNFRRGKVNAFLNYSVSDIKFLINLYAYRKYLDGSRAVTAILEQPSYFSGTIVNNTIKTGVDYALSPGTTLGFAVTGSDIHRHGENTGSANWLEADGKMDSSILTTVKPVNVFTNGTFNVNGKQTLSRNAEISADVDYLHYRFKGNQDFDNHLEAPGGYDEIYRSYIPTTIKILSAKADASFGLGAGTLQAGGKFSSSHTDNAATYQNWENLQWVDDETRSNRFIYREKIQAVYASYEGRAGRVSYQGGLRYEHTDYTAHQLGNSVQPDSSVSRNYGGFFPSGYFSYKIDSMNSLTLTVGRRTDRPPFQSLNPFLYIINKYTYQTGNVYLLPQYSWNFELTHQYGDLLTTGVSYSRIDNYFSQIFLSDTSRTILYYTQGNVGHVYNLGLTGSLNWSPCRWWSLTFTATFNHKQLRGFNGNVYTSTISQLNLNMNNQLSFGNGYAGEVSGFYTTRARNDIQELLYPTGQASVGLSKAVLKKKGTLKLSYRDIFYTNAMEGLTSFPDATEYFKIKRDTRVLTLAFVYRFGKSYKVSRHVEGASEEKGRVGNG
jgi:iron complex outermembrane receptor protein